MERQLYLTPFNAMSIAMSAFLKTKGFSVVSFLDNNIQMSGKSFRGIPISKPVANENADLMIFYYKSDALHKQAQAMGYRIIQYPLAENDLCVLKDIWNGVDEAELADILPLCVSMKAKDVISNHFKRNRSDKKNTIGNINLIITEKCSLRCKNCSSLCSYFVKPETYKTDEILGGLERLLGSIDYLYECFILGGEPFLHPDIVKITNACCAQGKIGQVTIITNGTILPSQETISALARNKNLTVRISDYGSLSPKLEALVDNCQKNHLPVSVLRGMLWYDYARLLESPHLEADAQKIFHTCNLSCAALAKNYFSKCNMALSRRFLNAVPDVSYGIDDVIDVQDENFEQLLSAHLISSVPLKACSVCSGRTRQEVQIEPAIQADHPIPYKKYISQGCCK